MKLAIAVLGVLMMGGCAAPQLGTWNCPDCWKHHNHVWASDVAHQQSVMTVFGGEYSTYGFGSKQQTVGAGEPSSEYQIDFCLTHGETRVRRIK